MKKEIPQNNRSLSREEMLDRHRRQEYQDTKNEFNEFSRRALAGLQYQPEAEALETTLNRLDRRITAAGGRLFPFRQILSIAAAAALLVAGYFLLAQPPGNEALFAQHFDYLPSAVHTEGGDRGSGPSAYEDDATARAKAMLAYEAGNYPLAENLMEKHLDQNERDSEIRLYLGIVLLGEGKAKRAASELEAARANLPQAAYERPAKWYLALAMLRRNQPEEARALFLELKEGKDRYAMGSRAVLKQL